MKDTDAPIARPSLAKRPPLIAKAALAKGKKAFFLRGGLVDAWFEKRSDTLLVTFDNLSSVGEYDPPQPWLYARAAKIGVSLLGIMASRKDWYRNDDTPALISALRDAGLFAGFRRVIFAGASMGGFAALAYARLVPGAEVLAFSPQSTLSRKAAPFEGRYRYGSRKWDWTGPFHDAAGAADGRRIVLVYDPQVPEDRAHAMRIDGAGVQHIRVPLMGHRAIRALKTLGVLDQLIEGELRGDFDAPAFWRGFRARRGDVAWQRALVGAALQRGHLALLRRAVDAMRRAYPDLGFPRREAKRLAEGRPMQHAPDQTRTITLGNPAPPFDGTLLTLSRALLVPERAHDQSLASGVLHAGGRYCTLSQAWIRARKPTPPPELRPGEPALDLPGTHLFAGHFRGHFGHFLVESTARLWALDHLDTPPDSILYLPYRGAAGANLRAMGGHEGFFRLLGIDTPIRTHPTVLRVERLIVPELGFGWSERYAGSPAYRAFMQGRLRAATRPEGGESLYVSRAKLNAQRGGILGETVIEENLARAGYEVFHPEKHPVEVQIARYRAARQIVALDGSALHLAAFVAEPGTRVGMVLRRSRANAEDYILQFRSFCDVTPDVIDVIRRDWISDDAARVDFRSVGEVDFAALFRDLAERGYLPPAFRPDLPDEGAVTAMLHAFQDKRGAMRPLRPGERHLDAEDE